MPQTPQNSPKYLVVPEDLDTSETEANIEINLIVVKFKYTIKKKNLNSFP